jgi:hypothetical protein
VLTTVEDIVGSLSLEPPFAIKIDTQGYELEVLKGAADVLEATAIVEVEMSLVPLYGGAPMYQDVLDALGDRGFRLSDVERVHSDPATGELLQFNGLFVTNRRLGL